MKQETEETNLDSIYLNATNVICNKLFKGMCDYVYFLVGVEIEFFINSTNNIESIDCQEVQSIFSNIQTVAYQSGISVENIEAEDGRNQFEIQTIPTDNAEALSSFIGAIQSEAFCKQNNISMAAKPYPEEPGSSMHFHISLYDSNNVNLFGPLDPRDGQYQNAMHYAINGLLEQMLPSMTIFAPTENCYQRYIAPPSGSLFKHNPTNRSWGINNRTCALRIPRSITVLPSNTRIEHRVCSPLANPSLSIGQILYSIAYGITKKQKPPEPIFGDAFNPIYFPLAESLPITILEAKAMAQETISMGTIKNKILQLA